MHRYRKSWLRLWLQCSTIAALHTTHWSIFCALSIQSINSFNLHILSSLYSSRFRRNSTFCPKLLSRWGKVVRIGKTFKPIVLLLWPWRNVNHVTTSTADRPEVQRPLCGRWDVRCAEWSWGLGRHGLHCGWPGLLRYQVAWVGPSIPPWLWLLKS